VAAGATAGAGALLLGKAGGASALDGLKANWKDPSKALSEMIRLGGPNMMNAAKYALIGIGIAASPRIPGVRMLAQPVNNAIKRTTRRHWGL
jgi:hypothetical protein